ncbi:MAG: DUF1573 domain-containing protein [Phycisphaerae bacterium]
MLRTNAAMAALAALLVPVACLSAVAQEKPSSPRPATKNAQPQKTAPKTRARLGPVFRSKDGRDAPISKPMITLKPGEIPKIKFDESVYQFGRVRAGTDVVHDFWYTNTGTGPLEILRVKPGCGCTTAGEYDRIVQPGKRGRIPIKLSTKRFSGMLKKPVTVNSNVSGTGAVITLQLEGEAWRAFDVTPRKASFGRVSRDDIESRPITKKLTIVNNLDTPSHLGNIQSSNPVFTTTLKTVEAGKKYDLEIGLKPPLQSGSNFATISIDSGIEGEPPIEVQVSVYVTSAVDVMPPKISILAKRERDLRRIFIVRNNTVNPIRVYDLEINSPGITAAITETKPGKEFRITLNIQKSYQIPPDGDMITLKTSHPNTPILKLPILVRNVNALSQRPFSAAGRSISAIGAAKKQPTSIKQRTSIEAKKSSPNKGAAGSRSEKPQVDVKNKKKTTSPAKPKP